MERGGRRGSRENGVYLDKTPRFGEWEIVTERKRSLGPARQ